MMGGTGAHEYMAPCPAGENDVVLAPGYAANIEVASADAAAGGGRSTSSGELHTPGATTIAAVADAPRRPAGQPAEGLPGGHRVARAGHGLRARRPPRQRDQARQRARRELPPGDRGRAAGARSGLPGADARRRGALRRRDRVGQAYVAGANRPDYHRVVTVDGGERGDFRTVEAGDTVNGHPIRIEPAIEIGNIFKLGTRYSEPLGATYLDETARSSSSSWAATASARRGSPRRRSSRTPTRRGSHGRRRSRPGTSRSSRSASRARPSAPPPRRCTPSSPRPASKVLLDDRDAGPGEKFADAELLGVPLRLTVGQALARVRARGGAGPPRPRRSRGRRAVAGGGGGRRESCGRVSRRAPAPDASGGCRASIAPARRRPRRCRARR